MGLTLYRQAVIPSGSGVSAAVDCRGDLLGLLEMPAALTTATRIVIEHSADGTTAWGPLMNWPYGEVVDLPFVANGRLLLPMGSWAALGWLRVVAGTSASPVVQAAAREFRFWRR